MSKIESGFKVYLFVKFLSLTYLTVYFEMNWSTSHSVTNTISRHQILILPIQTYLEDKV
jgi:hypothetical protein